MLLVVVLPCLSLALQFRAAFAGYGCAVSMGRSAKFPQYWEHMKTSKFVVCPAGDDYQNFRDTGLPVRACVAAPSFFMLLPGRRVSVTGHPLVIAGHRGALVAVSQPAAAVSLSPTAI